MGIGRSGFWSDGSWEGMKGGGDDGVKLWGWPIKARRK